MITMQTEEDILRIALDTFRKTTGLTVEMEIAALASVAQFRKVEYGTMLVISDSLTGEKWEPRQQSTIVLDNLKILYDKISQLLI